MFKGKSSAAKASKAAAAASSKPMTSAEGTSDTAIFLKSLKDPSIIERVRVTLKNAHVFKLPPRQTVSVGWRGADWREKVWQGTVRVVERGDTTAILLVDKERGSIFAVCPVKEGAVDRCIDSSRYFVLRIENASGRHMFIGVAFNERNDAFDFNAALEDSKREKEMERMPVRPYTGPTKDYSIKKGEKIHVAIPKVQPDDAEEDEDHDMNEGYQSFGSGGGGGGGGGSGGRNGSGGRKLKAAPKKRISKGAAAGGFLKPSSKDTPSRTDGEDDGEQAQDSAGFKNSFGEPFSSSAFGRSNPFKNSNDDPFFS